MMQRILSLRQATHALVDGTISFEMLFDDIEKSSTPFASFISRQESEMAYCLQSLRMRQDLVFRGHIIPERWCDIGREGVVCLLPTQPGELGRVKRRSNRYYSVFAK